VRVLGLGPTLQDVGTPGLKCERASRPLVSFGVLIDNTIKGVTCLHEIMSRYLIQGLMKFEITHVLQANVYVPLTIIICDKLE